VDSLLGAMGLPDIGQLFPDSDPKWKGASSDVFTKEAVALILLHLVGATLYFVGATDEGARVRRGKPRRDLDRRAAQVLAAQGTPVFNLKSDQFFLGENKGESVQTARGPPVDC